MDVFKGIFKKWWAYLIAAVLLLTIIFIIILMPNSQRPAFVQSASGTVEVDQGNGYVPVTRGMSLDESDRIRTGPQSSAIIVLYEHIIIRLEQESEVTISELGRNRQSIDQQGTVWTKVAHLSGTEDFAVNTPTTVATVRGTGFRIVSNSTHYIILGVDGTVAAISKDCLGEGSISSCEKPVTGGQKLALVDGTYEYQNLTAEDMAAIREQLQIELEILRELRLNEVLKNDAIMSVARSRYDATDADVEQFLLDLDEGRRSEDEVRANAPMTPDVRRVLAYNAVIREVLALIEEYDG